MGTKSQRDSFVKRLTKGAAALEDNDSGMKEFRTQNAFDQIEKNKALSELAKKSGSDREDN